MQFLNKKQQNLRQRKYCLENLKLRYQFILIVGLMVILIVAVFAIWSLIHQQILSSIFLQESDKLFDLNSKKRIDIMLKLYKTYLYQIFTLNGNALISFHRLYLKTKKEVMIRSIDIDQNYQMLYEGTIQIPDPLRILNEYGSNISNSFMCYSNTSAYDNPLSLEQQIGIKLQEQIQAYGQILYQGSLIMQSNIYSYIDKQRINNIYPCVNRGKGIFTYLPEKRDWYKILNQTFYNSKNYNEYKTKFTPPYLLFTFKTVGLSMTLPIVDENLQFIGGVASTFLGAKLMQYLSNNETGFQIIYLASTDGTLIMHPFNVSAKLLPIYVFNESITGFNITDWKEIINPSGQSNCNNFFFKSRLICRYNSLTLQEMIVSIEKLEEYDMYLIMLLSINEYIAFSNNLYTQINSDINDSTIFQITILLSSFIVLASLIILITKFLFLPIEQIVRKTKFLIQKENSKNDTKISNFIQFFISSQIQSLQRSFLYFYKILEQLSFHKTEQCKQIEELQYPIQELSFSRFLQYYQESGLKIKLIDCHNKIARQIEINKLIKFYMMPKQNFQKDTNNV